MTERSLPQFCVENTNSHQSLAEMEIWTPPQGTKPEVIPLDIDLRFDNEVVQCEKGALLVSLLGAEIQLLLEGFEVVRGSKFGDEINEPYVVTEIIQSVQTSLEERAESGIGFNVALSKKPSGQIFGLIKRRRKKKKDSSVDNIAKAASRIFRVIARNGNRWSILEPISPHLLKGRYLGIQNNGGGSEKSAPLCWLTAVSFPAAAKVFLRANSASINITEQEPHRFGHLTKNKKAVMAQIVRLSLSGKGGWIPGIQETSKCESVLLCRSILRCCDD